MRARGLLPRRPAAASVQAARVLFAHAAQPQALAPAIKLTILATSLHGLLLAAVLAFQP